MFFTITKPIQYIYQIEDHETLVKNLRSIPQESRSFGHKMAKKPRIYSGTSPEKLWLAGNDGYGWKGLRTLSLKMVKMARKLAEGGRKKANNVVAHWDHAPSVGRVARRPALKLRALGHLRLSFLLFQCLHGGGVWATAKRERSWMGKMVSRWEREREIFWPIGSYHFPVSDWSSFLKLKKYIYYFITWFPYFAP